MALRLLGYLGGSIALRFCTGWAVEMSILSSPWYVQLDWVLSVSPSKDVSIAIPSWIASLCPAMRVRTRSCSSSHEVNTSLYRSLLTGRLHNHLIISDSR